MRSPADWRKLFNGETPTHNRQFLERQLAYKLQEVEFRKVDPGLLDRNNKKIASLIATGKLRKRDRDFHPTPGTLFTREYHGKAHQVIAAADGQYEFEGRPYRKIPPESANRACFLSGGHTAFLYSGSVSMGVRLLAGVRFVGVQRQISTNFAFFPPVCTPTTT